MKKTDLSYDSSFRYLGSFLEVTHEQEQEL